LRKKKESNTKKEEREIQTTELNTTTDLIPIPNYITTDSKYNTEFNKFIEAKIQYPGLEIKAFCDQNQIDYHLFIQALTRNPKIAEFILNETRRRYHVVSLTIDNAIVKKAIEGDTKAQELYLKHIEKWNPQGNQPHTSITLIIPPALLPRNERENGQGAIIDVTPCKPVEIDE